MESKIAKGLVGLLLLSMTGFVFSVEGKRIKTKLKVQTEKATVTSRKKNYNDSTTREGEAWKKISGDKGTSIRVGEDSVFLFRPETIIFAGYDKQATSSRETFHIINNSPFTLRKIEITIIYKDMQGRMLHKRNATFSCYILSGETRKTDIKTWDNQNSFYYYLSNPPRRVATPYQVEILPLNFWVELGISLEP